MRSLNAYIVAVRVLSAYSWFSLRHRKSSSAKRDLALSRLNKKTADRIYRKMITLQGLYIKFGQVLSIASNVLPVAFRDRFSDMQDRVPGVPFGELEPRLIAELGADYAGRFSTFDKQPLASASIGQVHRAVLANGDSVAVKIQYPGVDARVYADLKTIRGIIWLVQRLYPHRGLDAAFEQARQAVLDELNYRNEAKHAKIVRKNLNLDEEHGPVSDEGKRINVSIPEVIDELSTEKVLTTRFFSGYGIAKVREMPIFAQMRSRIARDVLDLYCRQIFLHGFFHADPHPGNILVDDQGHIALIDFGSVATLSKSMREGLIELFAAAIAQDSKRIVTALRRMGFVANGADQDVVDRAVGFFYDRFRRQIQVSNFSLKDLRFDFNESLDQLTDLKNLDISLSDLTDVFSIPKDWLMLERTLVLLVGLCSELAPDLQPTEIIQPYVKSAVIGESDWSQIALTAAQGAATSAIALPSIFSRLGEKANRNQLGLMVRIDQRTGALLASIGSQFIAALLLIASVGGYAVFGQQHKLLAKRVAAGVVILSGIWLFRATRSVSKIVRRLPRS